MEEEEVVALYQANGWSAAEKPKELMSALKGSHTVVHARIDTKLVGLCNAIDGEWRLEGDRFIFTNDAFLGKLLSTGNDISSRLEFELTIVSISDPELTFEIGKVIDYTAVAGFPSSLRRIGTVGFNKM